MEQPAKPVTTQHTLGEHPMLYSPRSRKGTARKVSSSIMRNTMPHAPHNPRRCRELAHPALALEKAHC